MRIAYIEAIGGASGNMLLGAFVDAGLDLEGLESSLRSIVQSGWRIQKGRVDRSGISATFTDVIVNEADVTRTLSDVLAMLNASALSSRPRSLAASTYRRLAAAEAKIHGTTVDRIHFHEVGSLDAIIDVAASCIALDTLGIERVYCSPLPVGRGFVPMKHGLYPNPPPATAELLIGVPTYDVDVELELVTPTAAALLTTLVDSFAQRPSMTATVIGYGAGSKQYNIPNVTRISIGDAPATDPTSHSAEHGMVIVEANIDDMSPQYYELAVERIFQAGARDVWMTPIMMKKHRPAITLSAIALPADEVAVANAMLRETTTIGVRIRSERKYEMCRESHLVQTEFGPVRLKRSHLESMERMTLEYDDIVGIARSSGLTIAEVGARLSSATALSQDRGN